MLTAQRRLRELSAEGVKNASAVLELWEQPIPEPVQQQEIPRVMRPTASALRRQRSLPSFPPQTPPRPSSSRTARRPSQGSPSRSPEMVRRGTPSYKNVRSKVDCHMDAKTMAATRGHGVDVVHHGAHTSYKNVYAKVDDHRGASHASPHRGRPLEPVVTATESSLVAAQTGPKQVGAGARSPTKQGSREIVSEASGRPPLGPWQRSVIPSGLNTLPSTSRRAMGRTPSCLGSHRA